MKHFFTLVIIVSFTLMTLLTSSSTFAGDNKSLEELKKELSSLSGEKKVNRLNLLSAKTLDESTEESMDYCREALKLARELKYVKGEASALIGHAKYYRKMRKYDRALTYFQQALKLFTTINSLQDIGASQVDTGHMYRRLRKYEEALKYHQASLQTYEKMDEQALIAWSLYHIGNDYEDLERHKEAIDSYQKSLKIMKALGKKEATANVLNNLGYTYDRIGQYPKALAYYQEALSLYNAVDDKYDSALCLSNIGVIYDITGEYTKAIEYHLKALRIYEEIDDKEGISQAYNNIGVIYKNMGKVQQALEYYLKAVTIEEKYGSPVNVSLMYNNIGSIHRNLKQYDKALENYKKALQLVEKIGHKRGVAHTLSNIGILYSKKKQPRDALNYYKNALKINEEIGNQYSISVNYYNMAISYMSLKDYANAKTYLERALERAKERDIKDLTRDCYDSLSDLYTVRGDYKKALEYYKLFTQKKDEIMNKETGTKIAEMQTRYDTEKKEQRIALLEKNNEILKKNSKIQELTLSKERLKANAFIIGFALLVIIALLIFKKYLHLFAFWKKKNYIGHYKIVGQIGAGGMGIIYKAEDVMKKSDPVAIKVIREEFSKDENQRKRFLNEAILVDQLNHPNIIKVYERGEFNQQLYIAMEMLDGPSLAEIIGKGEMLPLQDCIDIMNQLVVTIHRIHAKGIVHRDLKPDNIIVINRDSNKNFVKLLDFGLARSQLLSSLTGSGEIIGTINYLPPEQISHRVYSPASDIYSLGVVFYELLTLEKPYIGELPVEIIKQILDKEPVDPCRLRPELNPDMSQLIMQMMDKHPDRRPSEEFILKTLEHSFQAAAM
jgi:tetratricopeptide (TPR) repeat protein